MNCSRFETLLSDYMDGSLDARVRDAMQGHLRECEHCPPLVEEVARLRRELADFPEVAVPEELVLAVLQRTSGVPSRNSWWYDVILVHLRPFMTQRYGFATLVMFAFLSFTVNVLGPGFSAFSYSSLRPSALAARADQVSGEIYKRWHEFNAFKARVAEEVRLLKEDLVGRLDYHLIAILFESYDETVKKQTQPSDATDSTDSSGEPADSPEQEE